jgi:CRISPR-associated protein Csy2
MMNEPKALILLPRLKVQNANAVSGPLTWGFPSPTAFAGFVHALERRLGHSLSMGFGGVGIICHKFEPQVSRPAGKYTQVFNLARNPLDKYGSTAAIVEEGRAHMEVSLLFTLNDVIDSDETEYFAHQVMETVQRMRLAGGSMLPQRSGQRYEAKYISLSQSQVEQDETFRKLRKRLLPGFALVQREDRLAAHLNEMRVTDNNASALDALLDLTRLNIEPDQPNPDNPQEKQWGIRKHPGWLVPIPVGYAGISPLYQPGEVRNARDNETPFRFVETLYSMGEWVSPHRLMSLQQLLWHQQANTEKGIYQCINRYADFVTDTTSMINS